MTALTGLADRPAAAAPMTRLLDVLLPAEATRRYRLYAAVAVAMYLLAWMVALTQAVVKDRPVDFIQADARGFYVYLPAIIINGNLDFSIATTDSKGYLVGPGILDRSNERGYVQNQWPPGVAMTLLPAFLAAHAIVWTLYQLTGHAAFAPNGMTLVYQSLCLLWVMAIVTGGMILIDRLLQRRWQIPGRAIAAAVLAFWVGSHYAWYVFREPFMAHAAAAVWVIGVVYLFDSILRSIEEGRLVAWHWGAIVLCANLAIACRLTNAVLWPFFAYLLWRTWRAGLIMQWIRLLPLMLLACAPLIIQAVIVHEVTGQIAHTSAHSLGYKKSERFYWTDPALIQSLISSRHGLFAWAPILLLSAWGLLRGMTREGLWRDPLVACFTLATLMLWYLNSAWYAWWFGWAFGNRGFLDMGGLFIIGFALCFRRWPAMGSGARGVMIAIVVLGAGLTYGLMVGKMTDRIIEEGYPLRWEERLSQGAWKRF